MKHKYLFYIIVYFIGIRWINYMLLQEKDRENSRSKRQGCYTAREKHCFLLSFSGISSDDQYNLKTNWSQVSISHIFIVSQVKRFDHPLIFFEEVSLPHDRQKRMKIWIIFKIYFMYSLIILHMDTMIC